MPFWWQTAVAQIAIQNPTGAGPTIASIAASGTGITNGSGDLNAGKLVTLTVNFSATVTVNTGGGTPTLALNDGGTASYTGGSGGTALTFSYTVAAGQTTSDLAIRSGERRPMMIANRAIDAYRKKYCPVDRWWGRSYGIV
ncbi:hypothetical protein [Bradyrhizobium sp. WSM3983]|uniref:hypothetical protein n=1 Tax=Bradyrhizobium sp. WSM3983 TaxID=1038867 RepID=UPI00040FE01B|nr:hypothetical protein [Bradyrhizobium sp. WSM3983]